MSNEAMNIMEEISMKSKVYIKFDSQNRITHCDGGYTIDNIENFDEWTLIDEGEGDRYNLCQSNYFDGGLYTDEGFPKYKYVDGSIVERSEDEFASDRKAVESVIPTPSQLDKIEAQVTYTAIATDTLLPEEE